MQRETKTFSLTFEPNTNLERMMIQSNLGTLKTSDDQLKDDNAITVTKTDNSVILGKKIVSSSKANVRLPKEKSEPAITGVSFMPNGKLLLVDTNNQKVKLLGETFVLEDSLELPSPWDVTAVDNNTAIVSLDEEYKLQYIHMTPTLKKGCSLSFDNMCNSINITETSPYKSNPRFAPNI